MNISEKIRSERKKAGLSQEALGVRLSVSRQAITKWENGTTLPEPDKLVLLSECFGVTTDYLLKDYINEPISVAPVYFAAKRKISLLLKFGIPMFSFFILTWITIHLLSVIFAVDVLDWDGTVITRFWGFLDIHGLLSEYLTITLIGALGLLLILINICRDKKDQLKKFILCGLKTKRSTKTDDS